jgi:hypothetical protein
MDILDVVKSNEVAMIERLKKYETLEYRQNNSKEKITRDKKIATEFLRSILIRKQQLISDRKEGIFRYPILYHD